MSGSSLGASIRSFGSIVLITVLLSVLPVTGNESTPVKVIVKKGDSLSLIVEREIGSWDPKVWKIVADFNNRAVGQTLEIGDVVLLPAELFESQIFLVDNDNTNSLQEVTELPVDEGIVATEVNDTSAEPTDSCDGLDVCLAVQSSTASEDLATLREGDNYDPASGNIEVSGASTESTIRESTQTTTGVDSEAAKQPATVVADTNSAAISAEPTPAAAPEPEAVSQPSAEPKPEPRADREQADKQQTPPPPKPGLFKVDEESAVRALERSLIQLNALLLSPRRAEIAVSYDYGFDTEAEPILVDVENTTSGTTDQRIGQLHSQVKDYTATLGMKFGLPYDAQINLSLPLGSVDNKFDAVVPGARVDNQSTSRSGVGDLSVSVDKTLAVESGRRPDIIVRATYNSDTGSKDIGSDARELSLGFRFTKRQDPLVFTGSISHRSAQKTSSGYKAGDVTQLSMGTLLAASPYTSLRFIFTQVLIASADVAGQAIPNSNANIASFAVGVSSVVAKSLFFNTQLSIGLVDRASDYRLSFSIAKQFSF